MAKGRLLRVAHLSDLHVGHVAANIRWLSKLVLPLDDQEGLWEVATRLAVSSWYARRSLLEPFFRSIHLLHRYETRNLVAVVQNVVQQQVDHIVLTGDVANLGAASEFREVMAVLGAYDFTGDRLTVVPGNHDVMNLSGTAEFKKVVRDCEFPNLTRASEDIVVAAVDTTAHGDALDWRDALLVNARGYVSFQAVERLDSLLRQAPPAAFRILCCHHHLVDLPPDGYVDEWTGRFDSRLTGKAENADALLDVAAAHGVGLILFGHRHRATHDAFTIRGIPAACSGAVTAPDWNGFLRYRVFEFDGPELVGRRWVNVSADDARMDEVRELVNSLSASGDESELTLTSPMRLDRLSEDLLLLREGRRQLDKRILQRFKRKQGPPGR